MIRKIDCELLVIFSLPIFLFFLSDRWLFTPTAQGLIDPWVYLGYFLDLPGHLQIFANTYYGSRLTWILPGYLIHKIFPPLMANYILHLGVYYISTFSMYFILRTVLGRRVALVTTILMGGYVWFLSATGWDYIDGIGIAYLLLTIAFLTIGARLAHWKIWLLFAGAGFAALIYTNLFLIIFAPFLATYYFLINTKSQKKKIAISVSYFLTGVLLLTTTLGAINIYLTGNFAFFWPSINVIQKLLTQQNPWRLSTVVWLKHASWLFLPSITVISCIFFIARRLLTRTNLSHQSTIIVIFQAQFVILFLFFLLLNLTAYAPVLQFSTYASYLIPYMFLAIGSQLNESIKRLTIGEYRKLILGAIILLGTSFLVGYFLNRAMLALSYLTILPIIFGSLSFAIIYFSKKIKWLIISMALFGASNATLLSVGFPDSIQLYTNFGWNSFSAGKNGYLSVVDSFKIIQDINPSGDAYFWYDKEPASLFGIYRAVSSTYLWSYRLVNEEFPKLPDNGTVKPGVKIFILSSSYDSYKKIYDAFRVGGFDAQFIAQQSITHGGITFNITLVKII